MQDYHQLDIWNRAMDYTVKIYAAVSVPLNIAEGASSASNPEFARFLSYAYRSLKELITALELCQRLYSPLRRTETLIDEANQISRMTYNLICKVSPKLGVRWE
jgi:four helix bundle protein